MRKKKGRLMLEDLKNELGKFYSDINENLKDKQLILIPKINDYVEYMTNFLIKLPRTEKFSIGNEYKTSMYSMLENSLYTAKINRKENIKETGICYLFESEKSVLQMEKFDMPNCGVAVCGSNFNKYQLNILMRECAPKEIIICFDKEEQGNEDKYFNKLYNIGKKYSNYCKFSFIYDREGLISLKDSPTDKGEEIFKTLLNKRVEVH